MNSPLQAFRCPHCAARLADGGDRLYETLVEHATDPNGEFGDPGARPTLVCSWKACPTHRADIFWSAEGEGPYRGDYRVGIRWIGNINKPLGSWFREYAEKQAREKR